MRVRNSKSIIKIKIVKLFFAELKLRRKPNRCVCLSFDAAQVVPLGCVAGLRRDVQLIQATDETDLYK